MGSAACGKQHQRAQRQDRELGLGGELGAGSHGPWLQQPPVPRLGTPSVARYREAARRWSPDTVHALVSRQRSLGARQAAPGSRRCWPTSGWHAGCSFGSVRFASHRRGDRRPGRAARRVEFPRREERTERGSHEAPRERTAREPIDSPGGSPGPPIAGVRVAGPGITARRCAGERRSAGSSAAARRRRARTRGSSRPRPARCAARARG